MRFNIYSRSLYLEGTQGESVMTMNYVKLGSRAYGQDTYEINKRPMALGSGR